jgi:hypothetical protein
MNQATVTITCQRNTVGYHLAHGLPMMDLGVLHLYLDTAEAIASLREAVEAASQAIAAVPPSVAATESRLQHKGVDTALAICLHVIAPVFRADEEGRIHVDDDLGGDTVTLVLDEPSLARLRERAATAAKDLDAEADKRRLIELGREYELNMRDRRVARMA